MLKTSRYLTPSSTTATLAPSKGRLMRCTVDGLTPNRAAVAFGMKVVLAEAFAERDFEGPAVVDIVAGRVPMMFLGLSISGPQVTSGKFHALAVIYRSADLYGKWN
jgi:hypothetical protein